MGLRGRAAERLSQPRAQHTATAAPHSSGQKRRPARQLIRESVTKYVRLHDVQNTQINKANHNNRQFIMTRFLQQVARTVARADGPDEEAPLDDGGLPVYGGLAGERQRRRCAAPRGARHDRAAWWWGMTTCGRGHP